MSRRILFITMVVLLAASAAALAGESTGRFTSHTGLTTETVLPDGGKAIVFHYYQLFVSDKADDPMNDTAGDFRRQADPLQGGEDALRQRHLFPEGRQRRWNELVVEGRRGRHRQVPGPVRQLRVGGRVRQVQGRDRRWYLGANASLRRRLDGHVQKHVHEEVGIVVRAPGPSLANAGSLPPSRAQRPTTIPSRT